MKLGVNIILIMGMAFGVPLAHAQDGGLVHDAGFYADVTRIDGPDYFGREQVFREAYEKLKSRYGNDFLPATLPAELAPIRDRIYAYIMKKERALTGDKKYEAGYRGINNPAGFRFWPSQLPTKIARLSYCFGISPRIMTALIEKESEFVADAKSSTGAVGFMQLTSVGGAEVLEQLGFVPSSGIVYSREAAEIYKEYINCYLGKDRPWVDPWKVSKNTVRPDGTPVINPDYWSAIKTSKKGRELKGGSHTNFDKWITGKIPSGSQDYGLVIGAVLLKYHLGHDGITVGLQNFNGDSVKVAYSRRIRNRAENVNFVTFPFRIFGRMFNLVSDGTAEQLKALTIMSNALQVWEVEDDMDDEIIRQLKRMEVPGDNRVIENEEGVIL